MIAETRTVSEVQLSMLWLFGILLMASLLFFMVLLTSSPAGLICLLTPCYLSVGLLAWLGITL